MSTDDDVTKPSAMPPQPVTKELPAADPVQVLLIQIQQSMTIGFRETNANIDLVTGDVKSLKEDVRGLQKWKLDTEKSPALTSERARAIVSEHASQSDLEAQTRESERILRDAERDQQIAETRALADKAATKDDMRALTDSTATRAEVEAMVAPLNASQDVQLAILARLDKVASNPTVKVIAGMIATALLTWLFSHGGAIK